jgi:hypothetical protein
MLGATDKTQSPITGLKFEVIFNENIKVKVARKMPVEAQKVCRGMAAVLFL